jgi:hypothetical protein
MNSAKFVSGTEYTVTGNISISSCW